MAQRSFGSGSRAQQAVLSSLVIWWSTLATVLSHPEYRYSDVSSRPERRIEAPCLI